MMNALDIRWKGESFPFTCAYLGSLLACVVEKCQQAGSGVERPNLEGTAQQ
jgi:hypothetical protein